MYKALVVSALAIYVKIWKELADIALFMGSPEDLEMELIFGRKIKIVEQLIKLKTMAFLLGSRTEPLIADIYTG